MAKTKVHGEYLKDSVVRFTAKAGENITKGQAVYISGISGEVSVVSLADANDTAKMPAFGLAEATVSTNAEVEITSFGTLKGLDTSSFSLGDILYVDTTAGSLTNNPSGLEATKLQNIGIVQRVHATSGSIKVGGAGRTNAVPNLDDGDIFIGDSNNKAVSDSFTNVLNSEAGINSSADATAITINSSENVGIGLTSPSAKLHVNGEAYFNAGTRHYTYDDQANYWSLYTNTDDSFRFNYNGAGEDEIVINTSGNVGIGQTSLGHKLTVNASAFDGIQLQSGGSDCGYLGVNTDTVYVGAGSNLIFHTGNAGLTNGTERMRIDSSGRFIVGNTSAFDSSSFCVDQSGLGQFRRDGTPLIIRRDGSDGGLIDFEKDGSTVGYIGANSGDIYIASTGTYSCGLMFEGSSGASDIRPCNSSGALVDNQIDLGDASARFNDLYLSGGAYLGGSGSANHLDDYEEGTWTPSFQSDLTTTYTTRVGTYTKVGNLVTAWFHLNINVNGGSSSQGLIIAGLPFAAINTTENYGFVTGLHCNGFATSTKPDHGLISPGANVANVYKSQGQTGIAIPTFGDIANGNMLGVLIYRAA